MTEQYTDRQVYIEGGCVCAYCGLDGKSSLATWRQLIIEHVIPLRCKPKERKNSPLNVRENKVVSCFTCNSIKRIWDKAYDESYFPGDALQEQVKKALEDAKRFIQNRYSKIDADYEPLMEEVSSRGRRVEMIGGLMWSEGAFVRDQRIDLVKESLADRFPELDSEELEIKKRLLGDPKSD